MLIINEGYAWIKHPLFHQTVDWAWPPKLRSEYECWLNWAKVDQAQSWRGINIEPKTFFLHSISELEEKNGFLDSPKLMIFIKAVQGSYEKEQKVFSGCSGQATWKYLSLSLDSSQTLSQGSCSDFIRKSKLMLTCFQEFRPRVLRKKIHFFLWDCSWFRVKERKN